MFFPRDPVLHYIMNPLVRWWQRAAGCTRLEIGMTLAVLLPTTFGAERVLMMLDDWFTKESGALVMDTGMGALIFFGELLHGIYLFRKCSAAQERFEKSGTVDFPHVSFGLVFLMRTPRLFLFMSMAVLYSIFAMDPLTPPHWPTFPGKIGILFLFAWDFVWCLLGWLPDCDDVPIEHDRVRQLNPISV